MASLISVPCRRCSLGRIGNAISNFSTTPMHKLSTDSINSSPSYNRHSGSLSSSRNASHLNSLWRFGADCGGATNYQQQQNMACCAAASLELEALAAVQQISNAVKDISVSEMLPRTSQLIFVNVTTWEGQPYCLELTSKGWRITSLRSDCMQGDFTRMELFTNYYESLYDLLKVISPESINAFEMTNSQNEDQEESSIEKSSSSMNNFLNNNYNEVSQKKDNFKGTISKCKSVDYENIIDPISNYDGPLDGPLTPLCENNNQKQLQYITGFKNCHNDAIMSIRYDSENNSESSDNNNTTWTNVQVSKIRTILNGTQQNPH